MGDGKATLRGTLSQAEIETLDGYRTVSAGSVLCTDNLFDNPFDSPAMADALKRALTPRKSLEESLEDKKFCFVNLRSKESGVVREGTFHRERPVPCYLTGVGLVAPADADNYVFEGATPEARALVESCGYHFGFEEEGGEKSIPARAKSGAGGSRLPCPRLTRLAPHGLPVLVVDGEALGPADVGGWELRGRWLDRCG